MRAFRSRNRPFTFKRLPIWPHVFLSSLLFGVFIEALFSPWHSHTVRKSPVAIVPSRSTVYECRFVYVQALSHFCNLLSPSHTHIPCQWHVFVTSTLNPHLHTLRPPHTFTLTHPLSSTSPALSPSEQSLLLRLNGCHSEKACNATTPCTYNLEDPSDALWLRAYENSSRFVVLFNIGIASLLFFLAAIVVDGSIFHPHRSGLADASASSLIMLSLASLLYVLIVPYDLQFALHGKGILQSVAYVLTICVLAILLPAIAVIWLSTSIFLIFLIGLVFEYSMLILFATLHFFIVLFIYQVESTILHVRLVYFANDEADEAEHDRQLLAAGVAFLLRVRSNLLFGRISRVVEERALRVIQNHLPQHVTRQFLQEYVPQVAFEDLEDGDINPVPHSSEDTVPLPPPSTTPAARLSLQDMRRETSFTEDSTLLQSANNRSSYG